MVKSSLRVLKSSVFALSFLCVAYSLQGNVSAQTSEMIPITLDQATILRLEAPATSLVIGNPAIADAIVQDGKTLVITGKGYGTTNLIGLDTNGRQLFERQLVVRGPELNLVTVYRGGDRETLSCAPKCQPAAVVGDASTSFSQSLSQQSSRNSLSQSQATATGQ